MKLHPPRRTTSPCLTCQLHFLLSRTRQLNTGSRVGQAAVELHPNKLVCLCTELLGPACPTCMPVMLQSKSRHTQGYRHVSRLRACARSLADSAAPAPALAAGTAGGAAAVGAAPRPRPAGLPAPILAPKAAPCAMPRAGKGSACFGAGRAACLGSACRAGSSPSSASSTAPSSSSSKVITSEGVGGSDTRICAPGLARACACSAATRPCRGGDSPAWRPRPAVQCATHIGLQRPCKTK